MPAYVWASRRHYFRKNHSRAYELAVNLSHFTGLTLWRIRRRIQRKPDPDPPRIWRDTLRHAVWPFGGR